ncbi:DUF1534 domain-containing protein [Pseudomonas syringae pv. tomato]|nr:DUF1534 domain-containing protein [Pseudomonas syringae pv. tomato]
MPRALQCTCTSTAAACACAVLRRCTATELIQDERRTIVEIIVPHAPRGNALRDAPRHRSAPHRAFKSGRGASRNACDAERRTIVRSFAKCVP